MDRGHDGQELVALFVLEALDAPDRRGVEAHLAGCATCAADVRALRGVCAALALTAPVRLPPGRARARVLSLLDQAAESAPPVHVLLPSGRPARRARVEWTAWLVAAASVVAAAGLILHVRTLTGRTVALEASLARALDRATTAERAVNAARHVTTENHAAMTVLAAADLARIDLAGQPVAAASFGRAHWSRAHGMVFTASHLPPLPPGKVYQVWVVTAAAPLSAGLLTPGVDGGAVGVFATPPDIPTPLAVAVTIEPAGGMPAPTGEKFLVGKA